MQVIALILIGYLLWRVETLSELSELGGGLKVEGGGRIPQAQELFSLNPPPSTKKNPPPSTKSCSNIAYIRGSTYRMT